MNGHDVIDGVSRGKLQSFAEILRGMEQYDAPVTNHFANGLYAREMFLTKGACVVGKIHKYPQINVLSKGKVSLITQAGSQIVEAGFHMIAPAGSQRAFFAHEDSIWTVFHVTEETDVDKIEDHFIAQSEREYLQFKEEQLCLGE